MILYSCPRCGAPVTEEQRRCMLCGLVRTSLLSRVVASCRRMILRLMQQLLFALLRIGFALMRLGIRCGLVLLVLIILFSIIGPSLSTRRSPKGTDRIDGHPAAPAPPLVSDPTPSQEAIPEGPETRPPADDVPLSDLAERSFDTATRQQAIGHRLAAIEAYKIAYMETQGTPAAKRAEEGIRALGGTVPDDMAVRGFRERRQTGAIREDRRLKKAAARAVAQASASPAPVAKGSPSGVDLDLGTSPEGFPLQVGPRGGIFHYSRNGNKVYHSR